MSYIAIILSSFIIGFISSIVATGPVSILVLKNALTGRHGKSIMIIFGSAIMETIYCALALTFVGAFLVKHKKIDVTSQIITVFILIIIGFYLFNYKHKKGEEIGVNELSKKEKFSSFLSGILLVAINPTIIFTWSAAIASLISFDILSIDNVFDMVLFSLSTGFGTIVGMFSLVLIARSMRLKYSTRFNKILLRSISIIIFFFAGYLILKIFGYMK